MLIIEVLNLKIEIRNLNRPVLRGNGDSFYLPGEDWNCSVGAQHLTTPFRTSTGRFRT